MPEKQRSGTISRSWQSSGGRGRGEGAAFAQVCRDYRVPFAAVRTVSDRADDEAHGDFLSFIDQVASRHSAAIVAAFLRDS